MVRLWMVVVLLLVMPVLVLVFLHTAFALHLIVVVHFLFSLTTSSLLGFLLLGKLAR